MNDFVAALSDLGGLPLEPFEYVKLAIMALVVVGLLALTLVKYRRSMSDSGFQPGLDLSARGEPTAPDLQRDDIHYTMEREPKSRTLRHAPLQPSATPDPRESIAEPVGANGDWFAQASDRSESKTYPSPAPPTDGLSLTRRPSPVTERGLAKIHAAQERAADIACLGHLVPPGVAKLPTCVSLAAELETQSADIGTRLRALERDFNGRYQHTTTLAKIESDIAGVESDRDTFFEDPDTFGDLVREVDQAGVQFNGEVETYFRALASRLQFELIAPEVGAIVDVTIHEVARVDGPVRRPALRVMRREAIGYSDGVGTLVRARIIAHHPEED